MHHSFLDRYSELVSPIHSLDARIKLLATILFLISVVSLPVGAFIQQAIFLAICLALWMLASLPFSYLIKRVAIIFPFLLIMCITVLLNFDILASLSIILKAFLSVLILSLFMSTTPFLKIVAAMQAFYIPDIFIDLLSFFYRFIYIMIDEFERLSTARKCRDTSNSLILAWRSRSFMLASFLIRSIERSERIYQAMLSRGFCGDAVANFKSDPISLRSIWITVLFLIAIILIRIKMI